MVKRQFEQPRRPDLLAGKPKIPPVGFSTVVPPISNVDCLTGRNGKMPTPPRKARTFPGAHSSNPIKPPSSAEIPRKTHKFTVLPPISQIDVLLSKSPAKSDNFDEHKNERTRISRVSCLNPGDKLTQEDEELDDDVLPSGRVAKKDHGIKPSDSEFIKLCKMNGRKNLLNEIEILNKSIASNSRDFKLTQKRTLMPSPNEEWIPSDWVKFKVYGKGQLR